jgi:hypothetical protein
MLGGDGAAWKGATNVISSLGSQFQAWGVASRGNAGKILRFS